MARGRTAKVLTTRFDDGVLRRSPDELIVEEPLTVHLDGVRVATTMRTPGHDFELAAGFCFTEGLLGGAAVQTCRYCGAGAAVDTAFNVVSVDTGGRAPTPTPRLGPTSSSCGVCGADAIDALTERLDPLVVDRTFPLGLLASLPERLLDRQPLFAATGAVHAAAAFDGDGEPLVVREDIGRHNAVDKVVGRLLLDGALPASDLGLYVSGRASFEMVQKAWAAGFGTLVAVSAPSALAVEVARRANLVLAGFVRLGRLNVYAPERLVEAGS
ncbi:MAG: formate dehydrogenase accessory sulfurtransferase FdhD [Acidimicrobiales bacterium]|jgi:FdhD protein|nr:formate dehydrogenase accessory sulfurtransferase FdhD [Acidimicrobiales bacterium]